MYRRRLVDALVPLLAFHPLLAFRAWLAWGAFKLSLHGVLSK